MVDAVIVSTACTGIGKADRSWLNNTEGAILARCLPVQDRELRRI